MENKRKYLFVTVIALFIVSFYTINLRFDPFYRVNGINNDNRMYQDDSGQRGFFSEPN